MLPISHHWYSQRHYYNYYYNLKDKNFVINENFEIFKHKNNLDIFEIDKKHTNIIRDLSNKDKKAFRFEYNKNIQKEPEKLIVKTGMKSLTKKIYKQVLVVIEQHNKMLKEGISDMNLLEQSPNEGSSKGKKSIKKNQKENKTLSHISSIKNQEFDCEESNII